MAKATDHEFGMLHGILGGKQVEAFNATWHKSMYHWSVCLCSLSTSARSIYVFAGMVEYMRGLHVKFAPDAVTQSFGLPALLMNNILLSCLPYTTKP